MANNKIDTILHSFALALPVFNMLPFLNFFTLKISIKVMEYNMCNDVISMALKGISWIFVLILTVYKLLTFQNVDIENLGQGHIVQHSKCQLMAYTWLSIRWQY